MSNPYKGALGAPELNIDHVLLAWKYATIEAMKVHRQTGVPVTTWDRETGQIVEIPADQIVLPGDLAHVSDPSTDSES